MLLTELSSVFVEILLQMARNTPLKMTCDFEMRQETSANLN